ncbi:MAG: hypothetical protein CMF98_01545 [Candidatus Marinimicrobia bacterium]|nr:hypothetical protein [Candidatus Neomarinimicrobiota bacterium]
MINPFDLIFSILLVVFGIIGFIRGFIDEIGRLLGLILGFTFSIKFHINLCEFLISFLPFDYYLILLSSFIVIFILIILIVRFLMRIIQFFFINRGVNFSNKILGIMIGLIKSYLLGIFLFLCLDIFTTSTIMNETKEESFFYKSSRVFSSKIIKYLNLEENIVQIKIWFKDSI